MKKRLIVTILSLSMIFLMGCGVNNKKTLNETKLTTISKLSSYLDENSDKYYGAAGYARVMDIVNKSIAKIKEANKEDEITTIYEEAKKELDSVATMAVNEMKLSAIGNLSAYLKEKIDNNYYDDIGYDTIIDIVNESIIKINETQDQTAIAKLCEEAKAKMDAVETIEITGQFYSLQEAYDNGWLTVEQLQSIAYYQSAGQDEPNIVPIPKAPEVLSKKVTGSIIKTCLESLLAKTYPDGTQMHPSATENDVEIVGYYGTYNKVNYV